MNYKIKCFQNTSGWDKQPPTIVVHPNYKDFEKCLKNWLDGKNPTDSPEWKKGVFAIFETC